MIETLTRRIRAAPPGPRRPGGPSPTLELVKSIYARAPHATLYTPFSRIRTALEGCSFLVSTDGLRLCAAVAYQRDSVELAWSLPERRGTLRNLLAQVRHRMGPPLFMPLMETGRRSWGEVLGLPVHARGFRAIHSGRGEGWSPLPAGFTVAEVDPDHDLGAVVRLMNAAYPSLRDMIGIDELRERTEAADYFAPGWFFLLRQPGNRRIGLAISGYDPEMDEGFIDWVELLPRYRRRGLGMALVCESLRRLAHAGRITVAGSLDAPFVAGDLYHKCGFVEQRQWTILGRDPSGSRIAGSSNPGRGAPESQTDDPRPREAP